MRKKVLRKGVLRTKKAELCMLGVCAYCFSTDVWALLRQTSAYKNVFCTKALFCNHGRAQFPDQRFAALRVLDLDGAPPAPVRYETWMSTYIHIDICVHLFLTLVLFVSRARCAGQGLLGSETKCALVEKRVCQPFAGMLL